MHDAVEVAVAHALQDLLDAVAVETQGGGVLEDPVPMAG